MSDLKLEEVYFFLLERTVRQFRKFSKERLAVHDFHISSEQWVVIKRVSEQEGINQKEIAKLTYKDPASVTRIIDLLQKKEWLERQPLPGDRRAYALYLTEKGKRLVEKLTPVAVEMRAEGLEGVSDRELKNFKKTLNKIYKNISLE